MNPKTPRALIQFAAILAVVGIVIMDPLAGLSILLPAGMVTVASFFFDSKRARIFASLWPNRRWPFGQGHLRRLLLIIAAFSMWKYPDARRHLERYRGRSHAGRQSIALPQGASLAMRLSLTGRGSNLINTSEAIFLLVRNATSSVITEDAACLAADIGFRQILLTEAV
jgi:hypothetical protein